VSGFQQTLKHCFPEFCMTWKVLKSMTCRSWSFSMILRGKISVALCIYSPARAGTYATRLNAFTGSCLFNATAVAAQCHSQQTNSESFARRRHQYLQFQFLAPTKLFWGPSPQLGTTLETPFSQLSFGKSFMIIRSAVPENGCLIFCGGRKKNKKKNICKTYTHPRLRK